MTREQASLILQNLRFAIALIEQGQVTKGFQRLSLLRGGLALAVTAVRDLLDAVANNQLAKAAQPSLATMIERFLRHPDPAVLASAEAYQQLYANKQSWLVMLCEAERSFLCTLPAWRKQVDQHSPVAENLIATSAQISAAQPVAVHWTELDLNDVLDHLAAANTFIQQYQDQSSEY